MKLMKPLNKAKVSVEGLWLQRLYEEIRFYGLIQQRQMLHQNYDKKKNPA